MSSKIDQRIVEMSFENSKFEKGIKESKNSLKDFSNALEKSFGKEQLSGLDSSVNTISKSFSALEEIAVGALRQIGAAAVNAGASLVKSLTIDQLTAGLTKYEQKLNAVQTMVSAGYDLSAVEEAMQQLMWFSDETSYSFSDMSENMAKFIASGVDLETSSKAMKGIATWAAQSGKNSTAASIAMFNLSQAISLGYVDTLNWRSIMNQNMNTTMFKQIAIGVAEATGAIKEGQVTIQNFDSNLKDKWFTNDVLLKTLEQYSNYADKVYEIQQQLGFDTAAQAMDYMAEHAELYGDVLEQIGNAAFHAAQESKSFTDSINATMDAVSSGWMRTYEIIFGTLDEAKANFSTLTEILWQVFASGAENRNEMLQWLKEAGGISNIFQGFKNIAIALLKVLESISKAFDQIFPPKTQAQWLTITEIFSKVTEKLIITDEIADKIQRTFAGFFTVIDIGWQVVKFLGSALLEVIKIFIPAGDGVLSLTANLGDFLVMLDKLIKQSGVFQYALLAVKVAVVLIKNVISSAINGIRNFITELWNADDPIEFLIGKFKSFGEIIKSTITSIVAWIRTNFSGIVDFLGTLFSRFSINSEIFSAIANIFKTIGNTLLSILTPGVNGLGEALKNLDFSKIMSFVVGGFIILLVAQIAKAVGAFGNLANSISNLVDIFAKQFKQNTTIKDLAISITLLAVSIKLLSTIPADDLKRGLIGLGVGVLTLVAAFAAVKAIGMIPTKNNSGAGMTAMIIGFGATLLIMAKALKTIADIDEASVWRTVGVLSVLTVLITLVSAVMAVLGKLTANKFDIGSIKTLLTSFGIGILALVGAIALVNTLSDAAIAKGILTITALMGVVTVYQLFAAKVAKLSGGNKLSVNILSMAVGLLAMVGVLKILSMVDSNVLIQAVPNLLLMAAMIGAFQLIVGLGARIGGGNKLSVNLLSMTAALGGMIALVAILEQFSEETLSKGISALTKIGAIIVGIEFFAAVAARISGTGNKLQKILMSTTISMAAMVGLIAVISVFTPEQLSQGIKTLTMMAGIITGIELLAAVAARIGGGGKVFGTMLGVSVLVLTLAGSLALLSMLDQEALLQASKSLVLTGAVLVGIAALSLVLSKIGSVIGPMLLGVIGVLASLTLVIGTFVGLAALIQLIPMDVLIRGFASLSKVAEGINEFIPVILGIVALSPVLAIIGSVIGPMLLGVIGVLASLTLVIGTFVGLAALIQLIPMDVLTNGFDALADIGEGIGRFFGSIIGGFSKEVLENVGEGLLGLFQSLEKITPESVATLKSLAEAFLAITAGAVLDGIARFITGESSVETFGKQLSGLINAFTGITIDATNHATEVLTAMAPMTENLKKFSEIAQGLPNSGLSVVSMFVGDNTIDTFGTQLTGLVAAFENITTKNANHATTVLAAMAPMIENLTAFSTLASGLPNSGLSIVSVFVGDNKIDDFAEQLSGIIEAFSGIDINAVNSAKATIDAINIMLPTLTSFSDLSNGLKNSGGLAQLFTGNTTLEKFAKELSEFVTVLSEADWSSISPALKAMEEIKVSFEFIGKDVLVNASASFKNNKQLYINAITSVLYEAKNKIHSYVKDFETLGRSLMHGLQNGMTSQKSSVIKTTVDIASSVISSATATFDSNSPSRVFEKIGGWCTLGLANGILSKKKDAIAAGEDMALATEESVRDTLGVHSLSTIFKDIGGWLPKSLNEGISNAKSGLLDTAKNLGLDTSNLTIDGLIEGISGGESTITSGVKGLLDILSQDSSILDIAGIAGDGIGDTITSSFQSALSDPTTGLSGSSTTATVKSALEKLQEYIEEEEYYSRITLEKELALYKKIQKEYAEGSEERKKIDREIYRLEKEISEARQADLKAELQALQDYIDEKNYYGQLSLKEELALYKEAQNKYAEGSEERKKIDREIYRLEKSIYEAQKSYIEEVTELQEDAAQKRLTAEKQYADAVEEIYKELTEKKKALETEYNNSVSSARQQAEKDLADAQKTYNEAVQSAYNSANSQRLAKEKQYQKDYNDILNSAEKEREQLRKEYANNQKQINDKMLSDIEAANKAYEDAVKSRADTIYKSYGLFEAVSEDEEVSGEELLQNLRDQGAALSEWSQLLDELAARGVGDALIEELQAMGPSSKAQIKALISLTDEQLDEYVSLFAGKYTFARVKAEQELVDLKNSTDETIKEIITQAGIDLTTLESEFRTSLANIDTQVKTDLASLRKTFNEEIAEINTSLQTSLQEAQTTFSERSSEINNTLAENLASLKENFDKEMDEINKDADDKLEEAEKTFKETFEEINKDVKEKLETLRKTFSDAMEDIDALTVDELNALNKEYKTKIEDLNKVVDDGFYVVEQTIDASGKQMTSIAQTNMSTLISQTTQQLSNSQSQYQQAGIQAAQGFANGINVGTFAAEAAATAMAIRALTAAKQALAIQSPSKVFLEIGRFVSQGLALGIEKDASKVVSSSELIANETIKAMDSALKIIEDNPDFSPTIQPIVDLSSVRSAMNSLSGSFGAGSISVGQTSRKISKEIADSQNGTTNNYGSIQNNFSLNGLVVRSEMDIDAIATKLYQKQQLAQRGHGQRLAYSVH